MSRSSLFSRFLFVAMSCFLTSTHAVPIRAAEATAEGTPVFRRLFVPIDAPESWPVGSERFLPVRRAEFSRLLQQHETPSTSPRQQLPVHVSNAVYRAELLPDNILSGTSDWTVELPGEQARLLSLSPLNFAIESASWHREPVQKASVGLWKRENLSNEEALELAVLVKQSGTLQMQWQLAAQNTDSTGAVYLLQKPIVVPQTFEIDLPANHSATLSHAQLLRTEAGLRGKSRWVFQLAPHQTHRLRIDRQTPAESTRVLPFVSQVTSYQLDLSGLNVLTQLRLDARESQITELKAALSSGLKVVEVEIDRQPVAWRVVDAAGEATLVISRPESRLPQSVEIRSLAKFRSDTRWELPKLRFNQVAWTEGSTSLLVSPDLQLRRLTPRLATLQHIVGIADRGRAGEVFRLQEWSREAVIEIEVGRPQPRLSAETLTTIELGRDEAQASMVAKLSSAESEIYQVQAAVAADWSIDSVTAVPQSTLSEWHLDREGNFAKLYVQLNQPISERQPLRLEIKASNTTEKPVLPATVGQLKLLRFLETDAHREWLQLRTRESKPLALADRLERARLAKDDLPMEFSGLTFGAAGSTLLDVTLLNETDLLESRQQPAQFEADLQFEVEAFPDSWRQSYQIDCRLRNGAVSEIVLEFDASLPETMQWTLAGQKGLVTREPLDANREKPTYLLKFPVAMTEDFRLQASYSQPAQPLHRCNFVRLPQSLDWSGHVLLRGSLVGLRVLDQGWTPTVSSAHQATINPAQTKTDDERLPVLGTYRIGPEEFRRGSTSAGLRLQRQTTARPAQSVSVPQLVAWLAEYHTLQAADGAALHTAHYSLENLGTDEAEIVLPIGAELQEAWLNNQQLELKQLASDGNAYIFRFGKAQHWPYLALRYTTHAPPLSGSTSLQPALLECSFPVNLGRWTLWAPEQYEIDNTKQIETSRRYPWWKRLLGPFARSRSETVFNPVSGASWTQLWAASDANQPTELSTEKLASRPKNPLTANLVSTADVSHWHRAPTVKNPLWNSPIATTLGHVGQRTQTVEFVDGRPTLRVRRAFVQRALWYALVLLTVVLGVWQIAHYPNVTICTGAVAGAACLTVPAQWLTLPQAVFLGLIAAVIIRVAMKTAQFREDRLQAIRKIVQTTPLMLLGCLNTHNPALGQLPASEKTSSASEQNLPRVLVPIDSQGGQQGEDVYLPEGFLEELKRPPRQKINDGAELVLLAANYSGSLPDEIEPRRTGPWTLRWKVKSYVPGCRLFLPLRRNEALWNAKLHRLDGVPVKLEWQPDGNGCSVVLPETGVHWLQLVAQPRFTLNDRSAVLHLHVPPLPGATLELAMAPNVEKLQVSGARRTSTDDTLDHWHGLLGVQEVLELRWSSKAASNNTASWERLEQSTWLHVDPAAARLDVQLAVTGYQADSLLLDLEVSAQLKLEQPGEDSPIAEVIEPSPGQPTRLQLKLRSGLPVDFVIPLRFELQRAVSVGRIYFPRVRVQRSPLARNLFAVSVSAGLSYDEQVSNALRSIEPTEFSRVWNNPTEEPLYAYAMGPEDPDWSLRVWPDPQSLTAQQSLRVYCFPNKAQVDFEAAIDELTGSWLSHRLEVPESLQIEAITVRDQVEANSVPVRWSRVSATEAVVFLGRPLRHAHLLRLQGHLKATEGHEIELPQVRMRRGERGEIHMDLYRTEDVQVSWSAPQLAPQEIPGQRIAGSSTEIYVGHYSWRSSQAGELSKIRLDKNDQKFETASVTTIHPGPEGWTARLNTKLVVQQGVVSRLSLTAPENLRKPFLLQPEQVGIIANVRETASGKEITVLLAQPAADGDEVEIRLSGALSLPADQRLVVPSLRWNAAAQRERYVLLPSSVEGQTLLWQTAGLRRQALQPQLREFAPEGQTTSYHLEQDQFVAKELTDRGTLHNALVRHAKVTGTLDAAGRLTATAELFLQPGRATSCAIRLPRKSQLRQLVLGDRPVRREQREDGSWKVPIGPPFMPQRMIVSYHSQLELTGKQLRLVPPKILLGDQALPAPQTWWQIRTTQGLRLGTPKVGHLASEFQLVKNSYQQPQLVLQDALSQALDLPRKEGLAWAQFWQTITRQAKQDWQAYDPSQSETLDRFPAEETQGNSTETFAERFAAAFAVEDTTPENSLGPPPLYPPYLPENPEVSFASKEHFFVSDSRGQLQLAISQGTPKNLWRWFAAIALVCGTLAVVLQLRHKPNWHHALCRWPHSVAMAGGFAWWLVLKPSAIGMLVILLTLISLALKQWRSFRHRRNHRQNTQLALPTS